MMSDKRLNPGGNAVNQFQRFAPNIGRTVNFLFLLCGSWSRALSIILSSFLSVLTCSRSDATYQINTQVTTTQHIAITIERLLFMLQFDSSSRFAIPSAL